MKKFIWFFCAALLVASAPSCRTKSGCPANESLKPSFDKKGQPKKGKKSKAQSGLFPKKMQKKMK